MEEEEFSLLSNPQQWRVNGHPHHDSLPHPLPKVGTFSVPLPLALALALSLPTSHPFSPHVLYIQQQQPNSPTTTASLLPQQHTSLFPSLSLPLPSSSPPSTTPRTTPEPNSYHQPLSVLIRPPSSPLPSNSYPVQMKRETHNGGICDTGDGDDTAVGDAVEEEADWVPSSMRGGFHGYGTMMVANTEPCLSCTTFNILAPIYKRLDKEDQSRRESQYRVYWLTRNQSILDRLLTEKSSIICLQEVWVGNEELVEMYEKRLGDAGYISFKLARTNNRGDGLLTALHKDYFRVLNHRELLFNDFGDRVAQLLHVESVFPAWLDQNSKIQQQILIVNTHLLFPHDYSYCIIRLRQVYKILQYVEAYQEEQNLGPVPVMLCGDWNGSKRGHVYKFLRSQGFISSYDTAHQYTDNDVDAHKWVSHRNHRGNVCGVDFIWLLNPNKHRKPLRTSWNKAIFGIIKYFLRQASLTEENAFAFLKADSPGDYITYSGLCQAVCQLGLSGHPHGLSAEDIEQLWIQADADEDGVLDCKDFQRSIWNPVWTEELEENLIDSGKEELEKYTEDVAIGLDIKTAALFPPEVEKGTWPENYSLSDHAPLTVVFSPRWMACSRPIC